MKITLVCDMLVHDFFNLCVLRTLLSNNPNVILRVMCSIHSSAVSKQPEDRCIYYHSINKEVLKVMELKNSSQSSKVSILLLVAVVCVTLSTKSVCYFPSFIVDYIRKCGCIIICA